MTVSLANLTKKRPPVISYSRIAEKVLGKKAGKDYKTMTCKDLIDETLRQGKLQITK